VTAAGNPAALDQLATALGRQFSATLIISPGRRARLSVTCRHTSAGGDVYADEGGWYWWPWAGRIAPSDDPQAAARRVTAVLRGDVWPGVQQ
jgi:hypothetical protein